SSADQVNRLARLNYYRLLSPPLLILGSIIVRTMKSSYKTLPQLNSLLGAHAMLHKGSEIPLDWTDIRIVRINIFLRIHHSNKRAHRLNSPRVQKENWRRVA